MMIEAKINSRGFYNRNVKLFNFQGAMKLCAAVRKLGAQEVIDKLFEAVRNLDSKPRMMLTFKFEDKQLRVIKNAKHELWFVAKDVAEALEYERWQSNLIAHVPAVWKGINRINTLGGEQIMLCLTEQGLYFFLGRSDKPKALPYQIWLASEVVPSIRKTGAYSLKAKRKSLPLSERFDCTPCRFYTAQDIIAEADITEQQLDKIIELHDLYNYIIFAHGDRVFTEEGRYKILQLAESFHELKNLSGQQ